MNPILARIYGWGLALPIGIAFGAAIAFWATEPNFDPPPPEPRQSTGSNLT